MASIDISEIGSDFKIRLPVFSIKSDTVSAAEKLIKKYGSVIPEVPVNADEIIARARQKFVSQSGDDLTEKEMRALAYLSLSLSESDAFFSGFFSRIQVAKSRRIISALFSSYVMNFDKDDPVVLRASEIIKKNRDLLSKSWVRRLDNCDLLAPKKIEKQLADRIIEKGDDRQVFEDAGLIGAFAGSLLVQNTMIVLAKTVGRRVEKGDTGALYDFLKMICVGDRIKPQAGAAALIAGLKPFMDNAPSAHLKGLLQNIFINSFSDPRVSTSQWPELSQRDGGGQLRAECMGLIKRWLNFEAIELFFKVIAAHAPDEQFEPRRTLWQSYFDQEFVGDAHIILGPSAALTARRLKKEDETARGLLWGDLTGANPDQSVLLMQIGDLTVAEWSHNGKFRAWANDSTRKPKFYKKAYSAGELRLGSNKIMNKNGTYGDGIVHLGDWVGRAKRYVNQETGIRLSRRIR